MPNTPTAPDHRHEPTTLNEEARWVAWKARGAKEDMASRRRMRVMLPLVAIVGVGLFYAVMVR